MTAADLLVDITAAGRPALRVEAAGRSLLLIRQGDEPVVIARVEDDHYGVEYVRTDRYRSPVPPLRADHAARVAAGGEADWWTRWAHHFRSELRDGPLHAGRWLISSRIPRLQSGLWRWEVLGADRGYLEWVGDWPVLPLRALSGVDHGRVKAYRRQARDGILPPVLLWWVSGLVGYVVVDGHDRLAAALAEDRKPPLLALTLVDRAETAASERALVDRYLANEARMRRHPGTAAALTVLGQCFGKDLWAAARREGRTRAWPLPGGTPAWTRLAARHAPDLAGLADR
ncbi:hypothetical protein [Actinoplanes sichuanensis]|uniref:Uncharacterized protein n=1 Tax=Actinoplanes sichuanensis TaxID=512349 RepID=A0ABW4APU2_9ACTN|nr:hypothetical protein [Actinoplanes sichuanensis]